MKRVREVDKAKMKVRQERYMGAKFRELLTLRVLQEWSLLPHPQLEPVSGHTRMHILHQARRSPRGFDPQEGLENTSFPPAIRTALRGVAASLRNLVVAPLQARKDGRRDHHRAGDINIHDDEFR